jgi:putative NADH-flavin reductase
VVLRLKGASQNNPIGASGTYGKGILARAEEIGVEAVVVTRSPHKFKDLKPTTTVVEVQLNLLNPISLGSMPI